MEIQTTLEALRAARELAEAVRVPAAERRDKRKVENIQILIDCLRRVHFSPKGVLTLLDELVEGRTPDLERVEIVLPHFNDVEPLVERAVDMLEAQEPFAKHLTLRAQRVLREIAYGKGAVRQKVKELLNYSLTFGVEISPAAAAELKAEILQLNQAIEDAEEALVIATRIAF